MRTSDRLKIWGGLLTIAIVGAIAFFVLRGNPNRPTPSTTGYYTGPKVGKGASRDLATEDGKITKVTPSDSSAPPGKKSSPVASGTQ